MRTTTVVLLVLVFLIGVGTGYILSGPADREEPDVSGSADSHPPAEPSPEEAPEDLAGDEPGAEDAQAAASAGSITGVVLTPEGTPVADVRVVALLDLELLGRDRAVMGEVRLGMIHARTGADGGFTLDARVESPYILRAEADDFVIGSKWMSDVVASGRGVRAGDHVELVAKPVRKVRVDVVGVALEDLTDVKIRVSRGFWYFEAAWSPEEPMVRIPLGTWVVKAIAGENKSLLSGEVTVEIRAGETLAPITLEIERRTVLRGRVTGLPPDFETAHVVAVPLARNEEPDPARFLEADPMDSDNPTDIIWKDDGVYELRDIEPGRWLVGVYLGWDNLVATEVVEVTGGIVKRDIAVPPPDESSSVTLHVTDSQGEPVEDLEFVAGWMGERFYPRDIAHAARMPDSSWRVAVPPRSEYVADAGRFFLEIRSASYGSSWILCDSTALEPVQLRLGTPSRLTVELPGYRESPWSGSCEARLLPLVEGENPLGTLVYFEFDCAFARKLGLGNQCRFGPVRPGEYELVVVDDDRKTLIRRRLILGEGRQREVLRLPVSYRLVVTTEGVLEGEELYLMAKGETMARMSSWVEDGKAVFEPVLAGEYVIEYVVDTVPVEIEMTVAGDTEVHLKVLPIRAVRVVIEDAEAALANSGLQHGDLIIGVDGVEFADPQEAGEALSEMIDSGKAELLVLRGDSRITVSFDLPAFDGTAAGAGGYLEPVRR